MVFNCRYGATTYHQEFKAWSLGHRRARSQTSWYELGRSARDHFRRRLWERFGILRRRLRAILDVQSPVAASESLSRPSELWHLTRRVADSLKRPAQPRLFSYLLHLALVSRPYQLESAN